MGMKKAVVSGAAGFVGSAITRSLIKKGVTVTAVVFPGYFETKNHEVRNLLDGLKIQIIECDIKNISNLQDLILDKNIDVYYNFAWDGLSDESIIDYTTQIMNIKYLMDAIVIAAKLGCKKFIGAGTISQYELRTFEGQLKQNDRHKIFRTANQACEYMGCSVAHDNNIQFFWPIITNIYGEGEVSPRLINTMIRNLLDGKRQVLSRGEQLYDFIHIEDAANAYYLIGERGKEFENYVIGSGNARPLKEFLCILRDIVNSNVELGFGELPFNGIYLPKEAYDTTVLERDTGFKPQIAFEEGIRRTAVWIKNNL
jgi:nucleoside-diphosphate-sugar epimerase